MSVQGVGIGPECRAGLPAEAIKRISELAGAMHAQRTREAS